ncbi:protein kinase family protein / peptidoglycan-binding LysM domain-containing protein [Artemisia annua]|uniref:Protein kinase family protein / peptidoglycan-binding LysM domain-containing protein n=1 Tax=Artemisia annua TaxID=35608 RepID=A0A2U1PKS3_ARTAN|nr:protein kinase family protein / peptidoglycan-binding LysM domain-containing protein [Artemisia annua]
MAARDEIRCRKRNAAEPNYRIIQISRKLWKKIYRAGTILTAYSFAPNMDYQPSLQPKPNPSTSSPACLTSPFPTSPPTPPTTTSSLRKTVHAATLSTTSPALLTLGLWNYLMSYVVKEGDSVEMLASRFGVSMDSIERLNGIADPDNVTVGALWYIPLNSVPGEPYPIENISPPAPAPVVSSGANVTVEESDHKSGVKHWWIIGGLGGGLAVILAVVAVFVCTRSSLCYGDGRPGHPTLSWIMRVQIALDTARGLEYIHEHTKPHYVHRDIKTSNILLDGAFKAKISDFGLAKLVGITNDIEASATRVVGTFGYLAPEYLRDGLATTKSDVYAFGVILFELISGKEALTRTEAVVMKNSERRSLASIMLAALKHSPDSMSMSGLKDHIDPNLLDLFPHDCVFKMATLAKQCVEEDPILRPDMKQIVITLSHILLSSVEWEATLAGNSQVFSGLVQGEPNAIVWLGSFKEAW